jgi:hypothetical protein
MGRGGIGRGVLVELVLIGPAGGQGVVSRGGEYNAGSSPVQLIQGGDAGIREGEMIMSEGRGPGEYRA